MTITYRPPYRRTRTSGGMTALSMPYIVTNSPGTTTTGSLATGGNKGWMKVMTDVVTPGYSALRKKQAWINHPCEFRLIETSECYSSTTTQSVPNVGTYTTRTWSGDALGYLLGPMLPNTSTPTILAYYPDVVSHTQPFNKAIRDCLNRIAPASSQSLVTAAEFPKTVDMIADRVRKLHSAITAVKRGDINKLNSMFGVPRRGYERYPRTVVLWDNHAGEPLASKSGKTVRKWVHTPLTQKRVDSLSGPARLWLEYRYGWSPLVYDIVDQMKALDAVIRRNNRLETTGSKADTSGDAIFKASAKEKLSGSSSTNFSKPLAGNGVHTWKLDIQHSVEIHAYAHYAHSVSGISSRLNDFGAFDVPKAIWELTPWSFVIDWFIPIGDWLGAITPKVGVVILASGVVSRQVKSVTRTLTGYTPYSTGPGGWPSSPVSVGTSDSFTVTEWARSVGLPSPQFPTLEVNLNLKRLADAAALLKGMR